MTASVHKRKLKTDSQKYPYALEMSLSDLTMVIRRCGGRGQRTGLGLSVPSNILCGQE